MKVLPTADLPCPECGFRPSKGENERAHEVFEVESAWVETTTVEELNQKLRESRE